MRIESLTDQELDGETGLYNYNARLYDPVIGRFITADSIVQSPGDPQTLNRYSYCRNNPLVYVDPSGNFWEFVAFAAIGALISGHQSDWDPGAMALGALTSVISAGVFDIAGGLCLEIHANLIQASAIHFAAGGIAGGINAAITGGNVGEGMLYGAASAGVGRYVGGKFNLGLPGRMFVGGLTSGTISVMNGGEFGQGFGYSIARGAMMAGAGYMFNEEGGDHIVYKAVKSLCVKIGTSINIVDTAVTANGPYALVGTVVGSTVGGVTTGNFVGALAGGMLGNTVGSTFDDVSAGQLNYGEDYLLDNYNQELYWSERIYGNANSSLPTVNGIPISEIIKAKLIYEDLRAGNK